MAKLTNDQKAVILDMLARNKYTNKQIAEKVGCGTRTITNLVAKLQPSEYKPENEVSIQEVVIGEYGGYILDLVSKGIEEPQAYYIVFSSVLEEEYNTTEHLQSIINRKAQHTPTVSSNGNTIAMTAEASEMGQNDRSQSQSPTVRGAEIYRADGTVYQP